MKKHSILVVDDEQEFLSLLKELLLEEGYIVTTALNGKAAIEELKAGSDFSVILSDERMPEMTGNEFLDKAKILSPETTRIMITAHSNSETLEKAINRGEIFKFLNKPVKIDELKRPKFNLQVQQSVKFSF
jgi:DNA-binding NtrC family response regulator